MKIDSFLIFFLHVLSVNNLPNDCIFEILSSWVLEFAKKHEFEPNAFRLLEPKRYCGICGSDVCCSMSSIVEIGSPKVTGY